MKTRLYTLMLRGVDGVHVTALDAERAGNRRVLGKVYSASTDDWVLSAPSRVVCDDQDLAHYRKIARQGALLPADAETAVLLGVPYKTTEEMTDA